MRVQRRRSGVWAAVPGGARRDRTEQVACPARRAGRGRRRITVERQLRARIAAGTSGGRTKDRCSALQGVHRRHSSRLVAHRQHEQPQQYRQSRVAGESSLGCARAERRLGSGDVGPGLRALAEPPYRRSGGTYRRTAGATRKFAGSFAVDSGVMDHVGGGWPPVPGLLAMSSARPGREPQDL